MIPTNDPSLPNVASWGVVRRILLATVGIAALVAPTAVLAQEVVDPPPDEPPLADFMEEEGRVRWIDSVGGEQTPAPRALRARPAAPVPQNLMPPAVPGLWTAQGPGPTIGGQVENVMPNDEVVGAIHSVLAHPTNPDLLYAAAVNGGIWRTRNATAAKPTWVPLTDEATSLSIGALEFDPNDPKTLLAGIGRFSSFARIGGALPGLLLSRDGGATFAEITDPLLQGQNISGVAIRANLILAAANGFFLGSGGLFRSTDGGTTWTAISGTGGLPIGPILDLVGDPTNLNRFYASVQSDGVYRSDDGGVTWVNVSVNDGTLNAIITDARNNNTEMAVASNGRLYVAVLLNGQAQYIGFTDNRGASFTQMDLPLTLEGNGDTEGLNPREKPGGQGAIHFSILADPTNPNIVYAGGDRQDSPFPNFIGAVNFSGRLFRGDTTEPATINPGPQTVPSPQWEHLTHRDDIAQIPGGGTASSSSPHADSREMVFDANGNIIQVDDGGIYRRTSPANNTGDWFSINGDIQVTEFHDIAYDSLNDIIIGGAQDTGTPEQIGPGSLIWDSVSTADGGDVAVDVKSIPGSSIRYSSFQFLGFFRRRTFDAANNAGPTIFPTLQVISGGPFFPIFLTPIELNAIDATRIAFLGANSVHESFDRGDTLSEVQPSSGTVFGISGAEPLAYGGRRNGTDNADVLYVGSGDEVFVRMAPPPAMLDATGFPGGTVVDLVLDPDDYMTAFVIDLVRVFMTDDGGATWTNVTGNLPNIDLRSIEWALDHILVGGRNGVSIMSVDNLGMWSELGPDLPNALVYDLVYDPTDDFLVAGTLGRGAHSIGDLSTVIGDADQDGVLDSVDNCLGSPPLGAPVTVSTTTVTPQVDNRLTMTTPVQGVAMSGLGCTIQDIINQAVASPDPCSSIALRRSVAFALRSLRQGNDLTPQETAAIRSASITARCP